MTDAYWVHDQDAGGEGWNDSAVAGAQYAPAPSGHYLTDGILALAAALTANPEASAWAFTDFLPGTLQVGRSDHVLGRFTYYLMFEHQYPESPAGETVGMTAAITALSSAIDGPGETGDADAASLNGQMADSEPMRDLIVLETLAMEATADSGCSWDPRDFWNCAVYVAEVVWQWIQEWGHVTLDVLSLLAYARCGTPLFVVGVVAAVVNGAWHAIEGDYLAAGLSLAAAVPLVSLARKGLRTTPTRPGRTASRADDVAAAASQNRGASATQARMSQLVTPENMKNRPALRESTKRQIRDNANQTSEGYLDPNTQNVIPHGGKYDFGHKPGYEWRCTKEKALALGWTRQQLVDYYNNPAHYQIEEPSSNRSHKHESTRCAP